MKDEIVRKKQVCVMEAHVGEIIEGIVIPLPLKAGA